MERVRLDWLPYDYPSMTRRFLRQYKPSLGIILETEIWPNLLEACAEAELPMLLANARLSERSSRRYSFVHPLARQAFARFSAIAAQSTADAQRMVSLGAPAERVSVTGNIKFDVSTPEGTGELARRFRQRIGNRKVLLAASLREGEEELLLDAMQAAKGLVQNALLVLVPRHPQRFDAAAELLRKHGLTFVRRSAEGNIPHDYDCLLGDSMGEMAAYYAACDCAFVGGSLLEYGGQNLIEACAAGVPVLIGPHTYNFAEIAEAAISAGAAVRLPDARAVVAEANRQLLDEDRRRRMGQAGVEFCRLHRGATAKTMDLCRRLLAPPALSVAG
jgi:3-deoxy-D-manno-octulosonic-acid transferase